VIDGRPPDESPAREDVSSAVPVRPSSPEPVSPSAAPTTSTGTPEVAPPPEPAPVSSSGPASGTSTGPRPSRFVRIAPAFWLWLSLFLPAATLYHPQAGWNVNTRLDLVFALVDQGTVRIDDYHDLPPYDTGDKAVFEGHFYSDKVFGVSLLAVVPYAVLKGALAIVGQEPGYGLAHWWMRVWAVGALAAGAGVLLARALRRLGVSPRAAFWLVQALFYGTLLFPYATVFYPYLPGVFFCLLGWDLVERNPPPRGLLLAFLAGLCLGAAKLMDFIFGLAVAAVALRALWIWRGRGWVSKILAVVVGGALPLLAFAVYTISIFGSLSIPYQYESDPLFRIGMSRGFMGITGFQPAALYYLTIHPYRGLFFWSPVLAAAVVGAIRFLARKDSAIRWAGGLALSLAAAYLVFNASYYMWWGGWAMGPRLLIPAIPFLGVGVAGLWRWGRGGRAAVIATGVASVVLILPPALVDPQTPMWLHKWPDLLNPSVGQHLATEQFLQLLLFARGQVDVSLGGMLGLPGLWALLPTLLVWAVPAWIGSRLLRPQEISSGVETDPER